MVERFELINVRAYRLATIASEGFSYHFNVKIGGIGVFKGC